MLLKLLMSLWSVRIVIVLVILLVLKLVLGIWFWVDAVYVRKLVRSILTVGFDLGDGLVFSLRVVRAVKMLLIVGSASSLALADDTSSDADVELRFV